jgi:hypothetical protein
LKEYIRMKSMTAQSTEQTALKALDELEKRSKHIEEAHLPAFRRFRRRWLNWKVVAAWNVSSWFTVGQIAFGKAVWAWLSVKAPWVVSGVKTLWGWFVAGVAAVVTAVTP